MKRILAHAEARLRAHADIDAAPDDWVADCHPPGRNGDQNALLHALIGDIAARVEWAGKKRDPETWKRLLVAAWSRVHGESVEILPALDGHGVDIVPARTSALSRKECADLISFIEAWAAENVPEAQSA